MAASHHPLDLYPVHRVPPSRPFIWLAAGWDSMMHSLGPSLAYGALVALLGAMILNYQEHPLYIAAAVCAFLVVGPVITAGVCELARRRDHGESSNFQDSLEAIRRNRRHLLGLAEVLLFVALAGFSVAALALYTTVGSIAPAIEATVWGNVVAELSSAHLLAYGLAFAAVSTVVFLLSVVSVPMMIDRHVEPGIAVRMSLRVAARDLPAMVIWAALIISLVAFGFGTRLWGMVLVVPLLGHATWYAYRDTVEEE
ncbi:DUF2189 domain-containing protein [Seongchinamella sediminis]|uniref:DUF2189 domain-containing protein n=1 Tax=Seongchinamella sediminis TaxID=2283635 RepID=A0A3L7E0W6_9GAMM|nr:DUF2189 domain-containing protein [Seongchinamella sediminis]RLQ22440.1 DUF2189 domain-containing protein [Seongchinamella sediminis]